MLPPAAYSGTIEGLVKRLSVHLVANPLSADETKAANGALLAGRAMVDAMDEIILGKVYTDFGTCIAKASTPGAASRQRRRFTWPCGST